MRRLRPFFPFSRADTGLPLIGSPAFSGVLALALERGVEPDGKREGGRMAEAAAEICPPVRQVDVM